MVNWKCLLCFLAQEAILREVKSGTKARKLKWLAERSEVPFMLFGGEVMIMIT
jgi:hypothetical protein